MMTEADTENTRNDFIMTPKVALAVGLGIPAFFFLLDDLLGLINGGGLFSTWSALQAASGGVTQINVDHAGMRTLFVLLCSISVIWPSAALRANLTSRLATLAVITPIIAGGFVFDALFDESIVGRLVAIHGYSRCENGDFQVGHGKGEVWFNNYVLDQTSCPLYRRWS